MKKRNIAIGIFLIFAAVLLILGTTGVIKPLESTLGTFTALDIFVGIFLLAQIIEKIIRRQFWLLFLFLAIFFVIFEENIAFICGLESENIINNWLVFLIAFLFAMGFSILFPPKKNHKSHTITLNINRKNAENNLGSSTLYIDCESFSPSRIENNLGACSIYFENPASYKGNETLYVENSLGSMLIHVPSSWTVKADIECNLGGFRCPENITTDGPVLYIKGESNLGSMTVSFV